MINVGFLFFLAMEFGGLSNELKKALQHLDVLKTRLTSQSKHKITSFTQGFIQSRGQYIKLKRLHRLRALLHELFTY